MGGEAWKGCWGMHAVCILYRQINMMPSLHTTCRRARMRMPYPTQAQADTANDANDAAPESGAAPESDGGTPVDGDTPTDGFTVLQDMLDTHHAKEQRRAEESAKRARNEFESRVREALGSLDDTLTDAADAHAERCGKFAKLAADTLDRLTASEGKLGAERAKFDASAAALIRCTKQDIETEQQELLPRAHEIAIEVGRGVASIKRLAQRHVDHHTNLLQSKAEWDETAADIERTVDEHAQDALRSLNELSRRRR